MENIPEQIAKLNGIVLEYCVSQVYSEAIGYIKYKQEVSYLPVPIDPPTMMNQKHSKQLELPNWF